MKAFLRVTLCIFYLACSFLFADQVILKNGDHLSGHIEKLDEGKLVLTTDYAGNLHIDWNAITSFTADAPLYVTLPDQTITQATQLTREDDKIALANGSGSPVMTPGVQALRSSSEQGAYEKSLHPGLLEYWSGGVNFGFALARGNTKTTNLTTGTDIARKTRNDKFSLYETSVYTTDKILNATTASAIRGGVRYDRDFNKRIFAYGSEDLEHDELQGLDLRSIAGGGLGLHLIATKRTVLDVLSGLAWTHESFNTIPTNNILSGQFGEEFTYHLWNGTDLKERGFFYPNFTGPTDSRAALDIGITSRIYKRLVWQNTVSDRYDSNPQPGKVSNDLLISTGIGVTLGSGAH